MPDAVTSSLGVVAYLALFAAVGILFLLVNLVVGKFVRASDPTEEKLDTYECGEPAVGSSFVQFDLRFYVVALLFIIFDVEVAFFFPWATVFGKSAHLSELAGHGQVVAEAGDGLALTPSADALYRELGVHNPVVPTEIPASLASQVTATTPGAEQSTQIIEAGARQFAMVTIVDIAVFFAVLLVGFAYVWRRGDLDWVRAYRHSEGSSDSVPDRSSDLDLEQVLSV